MAQFRFLGPEPFTTVFGRVFHRDQWVDEPAHVLADHEQASLAQNPTFETKDYEAPEPVPAQVVAAPAVAATPVPSPVPPPFPVPEADYTGATVTLSAEGLAAVDANPHYLARNADGTAVQDGKSELAEAEAKRVAAYPDREAVGPVSPAEAAARSSGQPFGAEPSLTPDEQAAADQRARDANQGPL